MKLDKERRFLRQSEDSLLNHGTINVIVLDDDVLLQDFDCVQLVCPLPLSQHHLHT